MYTVGDFGFQLLCYHVEGLAACRMMAAAGCLVTAERTTERGDLMVSTLVLWLKRLDPAHIADWPVSLSSSSLDVGIALLECAAAEGGLPEGDLRNVMIRTMMIGSIPLATAALRLLPQLCPEVTGDIIKAAGVVLNGALERLPHPGRVSGDGTAAKTMMQYSGSSNAGMTKQLVRQAGIQGCDHAIYSSWLGDFRPEISKPWS